MSALGQKRTIMREDRNQKDRLATVFPKFDLFLINVTMRSCDVSPSTVFPVFTNSSVCLVQSGLRKPAGIPDLVTRFYSGSFRSRLGSVFGDGATVALDFPSIIGGYRMENFPWHSVFLSWSESLGLQPTEI